MNDKSAQRFSFQQLFEKFTVNSILILLIGFIGLIFFSFSKGKFNLSDLSQLCLFAGACVACGVLLGLLFGVPKATVISERHSDFKDREVSSSVRYRPNTNLEQVSDWLTKMLLGIGLTQFSSISTGIASISQHFHGFPENLIISVLIYFSVFGFLCGYIWTRVYLDRFLKESESSIKRSLNEHEHQLEIMVSDHKTNSLIQKHLSEWEDPEDYQELRQHILATSDIMAKDIFRSARRVRRKHWSSEGEKLELVNRTVPIFRYLIERSRKQGQEPTHKNYAQYAYSIIRMKNANVKDYELALKNITLALSVLEKSKVNDDILRHKGIYLFNKCLCEVMLSLSKKTNQYNDVILKEIEFISELNMTNLIYEEHNYNYFKAWSENYNIELPKLSG